MEVVYTWIALVFLVIILDSEAQLVPGNNKKVPK